MICIEDSRFFLAPLLILQIYYYNLYIQIQKSAWGLFLLVLSKRIDFFDLGCYPAAERAPE